MDGHQATRPDRQSPLRTLFSLRHVLAAAAGAGACMAIGTASALAAGPSDVPTAPSSHIASLVTGLLGGANTLAGASAGAHLNAPAVNAGSAAGGVNLGSTTVGVNVGSTTVGVNVGSAAVGVSAGSAAVGGSAGSAAVGV